MKNQQVDLPGQPTPVTNFVDPPTSPSRDTGIAAGSPKSKNFTSLTSPPYVFSYHPLTTTLPLDIGDLAWSLTEMSKKVVFFQTCMAARAPPDLRILKRANHPAVPLVNSAATHGLTITNTRGTN